MPSIKIPEYISLNIPFIFILLIFAVSLTISFYFYKRSVPEIKNSVRYILLGLRTIVIMLLLILLFSPKLSLIFLSEVFPTIAVYIDNSASMAIDRHKEELSGFVDNIEKKLPQSDNISWFYFNSRVEPFNKTELKKTFNYGTDFNKVLKDAEKKRFSKILLISDGNNTESGNFSDLSIPIVAVGVGKISVGADIYIADIKYNSIARTGKEETVEVVIANKNSKIDRKLHLKLFSGKKLIKSKIIPKFPAGVEESISFKYTPLKKGLSRFTVLLDTLKGEENIKNNRRVFVQKIIDKKRKVGLFIGIPDYDSKFIELLLSKNSEFDIYKYVDRMGNISASLKTVDSLDVIFFCNFPGQFTSANTMNVLKKVLAKKHTGVVIKPGEGSDINKLKRFNFLLPYQGLSTRAIEKEYMVEKSDDAMFLLFSDEFLNNSFWQKVPPIMVKYIPQKLKNGAVNILQGSNEKGQIPLITTYHKGNSNSIYMGGAGYWRWFFTLTRYTELLPAYQKLLSNMVYYLSNTQKLESLTLKTDKRVLQLGEKVVIKIDLYDNNFEAIANGNVELDVLWNKEHFKVDVSSDSSGSYLAEFYPPGDGKYIITAKGSAAGTLIGKKKMALEVVPVEKEFLSTSQNADFLRSLAKESSGQYFNISADPDSILAALAMKSKTEIRDKNIELWYKPFMVILIIVLITLEWIIRRKYRLL